MAVNRTDSMLAEKGEAAIKEALTAGFSRAFWVAFGFAVISLLVSLVVLRKRDLQISGEYPNPPAG